MCWIFSSEGLSNYLPRVGFQLRSSWSLPPNSLGLQVWVTSAWWTFLFINEKTEVQRSNLPKVKVLNQGSPIPRFVLLIPADSFVFPVSLSVFLSLSLSLSSFCDARDGIPPLLFVMLGWNSGPHTC
jgi:hypothetical protein